MLAWNATLDPFCVCVCECVCVRVCGVGVSYLNKLSFMHISLESVLMKFVFLNMVQCRNFFNRSPGVCFLQDSLDPGV